MFKFNEAVNEHVTAITETINNQKTEFKEVYYAILHTILHNKIMIFGNGGSAADAQHVAAEFVNRFEIERNPFPMIALTTDTSIITAIGNDYNFNLIYSKQIDAIGRGGDLVIGISTSGNSPNIIKAFETAKKNKLQTILFTGTNPLKDISNVDIIFKAQSQRTATIQEVHIFIWHLICKAIDYKFKDT